MLIINYGSVAYFIPPPRHQNTRSLNAIKMSIKKNMNGNFQKSRQHILYSPHAAGRNELATNIPWQK